LSATEAPEVAGSRDAGGWIDFRIGYQAAFNGLRGFAIVTFMIYHGQAIFQSARNVRVLPGAFFWLEMFFVQSGFLIISLLIEEWYRTGRIRILNFYARRALRLFPALFVVCAAVALWLLTFAPSWSHVVGWREVWSTLLYVNNWVGIHWHNSLPLYLGHGWSLSVEEQFYAVAPFVTLGMLAIGWSGRRAIAVVLVCALASAIWMVVLSEQGSVVVRLYQGTDTRAQGFLIGGALAFAASAGFVFRGAVARAAVRVLVWPALLIVVALLLWAQIDDPLMYHGMFTLAGLSFAVLLAYVVQEPQSLLTRALSVKPLESTGRIAYGIYLWHLPIMVASWNYIYPRHHWSEPLVITVWIAASILVASASWRWVEQPFLRYARRFGRIDPAREQQQIAARLAALTDVQTVTPGAALAQPAPVGESPTPR
jgi:peptidoglycan/LPS O-acetylase OafA/YrhL